MNNIKCIKAVVIEGDGRSVTTVDKVYKISKEDDEQFCIVNDRGGVHWFDKFGTSSIRCYFNTADYFTEVVEQGLSNTVILLNSPPNSGKDTICKAICEVTGASHNEFKHHLYKCAATLFNMELTKFIDLATGRNTKEVPIPSLKLDRKQYFRLCDVMERVWGLMAESDDIEISPREALIYTSEVVVKPNFGVEYFGNMATNNINLETGAVFSDSGFNEELTPIINRVGAKNVFVVQLSREGTTFDGDSRNYLTVPDGVPKLITSNDGTIDEVVDNILSWVSYEREVQQGTFG